MTWKGQDMNNSAEKSKKERNVRSAREKCRAVLAVWTQQRRPAEVCRELNVPANLINNWQARALEGMLQALEPRTRQETDRGPWLAPRMEQLLERKLARLETRIARQGTKPRPAVEKAPASA